MSVEENKAVVRRYYDFWNQHDFEACDDLVAQGFISHRTTGDVTKMQIPGSTWGMDKMVAEGDLVVVLGKMRGVHRGPYKGTPPTRKKVELGYTVAYRITDGRVVEAWSSMDWFGLLQQIGGIPAGHLAQ